AISTPLLGVTAPIKLAVPGGQGTRGKFLEMSEEFLLMEPCLPLRAGLSAPSRGRRFSKLQTGPRRRSRKQGGPNLPISRPPSARPHLPCRLGGLLLIGHDEDVPNLVRDLRLRTNRLWAAASPTARKRL